ncbi:type IV secretory system conjugative DNA transfer family protein [bacterium]|nr:type IV secretory system conjugative DNA transfer family protein [bacterium]
MTNYRAVRHDGPVDHRVVFGALAAAGAVLSVLALTDVAAAQNFGTWPTPPAAHPVTIWTRLLAWGLALASGGLLGAFCSDKAKPFRRFLALALALLIAIAGALASASMVSIELFVAGFAVAYLLLRLPRKRPPRDTTFGSAEWATLEHLRAHGHVGEEGLFLGLFEADGERVPVQYKGDRHLLTVAPTRSGKGTTAIVPNLFRHLGSALVMDVKGENARITAVRRGEGNSTIPGMKQKLHIVDPWGVTGLPVSRFNPLDFIANDELNGSENAMILADALVPPHGSKSDPFWDEEAKALLMGFILFVALDASEEGHRHLGRVRDIIVADADQLTDILARMIVSPHRVVQTTAARTVSKDEKLRSNVFASLQSHTHFLDSPAIRESLSCSDFSFDDLKTQLMTVYLVLPADRLSTFGRWLRLLVQQAITVNARNIEQQPEHPILFVLDEMAALGRLTMVEQAYSLMAGFGMQLWGIVQDLSQLERIYDKGWETFVGNAGVVQNFGSRDHRTAEYFSKLAGLTTLEKLSIGRSIANAVSSAVGGNSTTTTNSYTRDVVQRQLAYPDELMVMRDDAQLVFIENCNPIRGCKQPWFADPQRRSWGIDFRQFNGSVTPTPPTSSNGHDIKVEIPTAGEVHAEG